MLAEHGEVTVGQHLNHPAVFRVAGHNDGTVDAPGKQAVVIREPKFLRRHGTMTAAADAGEQRLQHGVGRLPVEVFEDRLWLDLIDAEHRRQAGRVETGKAPVVAVTGAVGAEAAVVRPAGVVGCVAVRAGRVIGVVMASDPGRSRCDDGSTPVVSGSFGSMSPGRVTSGMVWQRLHSSRIT